MGKLKIDRAKCNRDVLTYGDWNRLMDLVAKGMT